MEPGAPSYYKNLSGNEIKEDMADRDLLRISKVMKNGKGVRAAEKKIKDRKAKVEKEVKATAKMAKEKAGKARLADFKAKGYFDKKDISPEMVQENMKGVINQFSTGIRGHELANLIGSNEELFQVFGHLFHWDANKSKSEFSPGMLPQIMGHGDVYSLKQNQDGRFELVTEVPKGGMGGDSRPVTFITKNNLANFEKQVGTIINKG